MTENIRHVHSGAKRVSRPVQVLYLYIIFMYTLIDIIAMAAEECSSLTSVCGGAQQRIYIQGEHI